MRMGMYIAQRQHQRKQKQDENVHETTYVTDEQRVSTTLMLLLARSTE